MNENFENPMNNMSPLGAGGPPPGGPGGPSTGGPGGPGGLGGPPAGSDVPMEKASLSIEAGTALVENAIISAKDHSAVENGGNSVLVLRDCQVIGQSTKPSEPLSGPPGGLLVSGSVRTTLAVNQSQAFYINSKVESGDWAALSTDGAKPVTEDSQKEVAVYTYGGEASVADGGYGLYSDLFCNVYLYGTEVRAAEIGAISGTYGTVTLGTLLDGEACPELAEHLIDSDKDKNPKNQGVKLIGGRNAVMMHSVSLPPYWGYKGYSQDEIPLYRGKVHIHGGLLKTDLSLDKNVKYNDEQTAYIGHHKGSVILTKSCNTDIILDGVEISCDPNGTGAVLHSVINADVMFSTKVPDGADYPGVGAALKDMDVKGNILHEDYQRKMQLTLDNTTLSGSITAPGVENWNALCKTEGFESCIIDTDGYKSVHGVELKLTNGSVWKVCGKSELSILEIEDGCKLECREMTVDGVETPIAPGKYSGLIVIE